MIRIKFAAGISNFSDEQQKDAFVVASIGHREIFALSGGILIADQAKKAQKTSQRESVLPLWLVFVSILPILMWI